MNKIKESSINLSAQIVSKREIQITDSDEAL